jgi:hypothetical protein
MRSLPLIAVALAFVGFTACGRTSLFGWEDLDGGVPVEVDAGTGTGGARRDAGAGGTGGFTTGGTGGKATGGSFTGGSGGTGGATGGTRDGGSVDGGVFDGGVGGRRPDAGSTGGVGFDGGLDGRTDGGSVDSRPDTGGTGGRPDGGPIDGIGFDGGSTGGSGGTGGAGDAGSSTGGSGGTGGSGTGGSTDAGIYECDPVAQDCAAGLRCDLPDNGHFVFRCLPDKGGQAGQNQVCQDSTDCIKGASCLQDSDRFGNPIGSALCTVFCYVNADCPRGNHCLGTGIVGSGGDLTFGLCLPNR